MITWLLIALSIVLIYLLLCLRKKYTFWEKKKVPFVKPKFLLGVIDIIQTKNWSEKMKEIYDAFPNSRYCGGYMFYQPFFFVRDLDLIKRITVKDFDHFVDRRTISTDEIDPLWSRNLGNVKGERWRNLRSILSPSFTGSKMRIMFNLMEKCALQFIDHLENEQAEVVEKDIKDVMSRYTNDVISTTAFGLEIDSFKNKENEFFSMGKTISNANLWLLLRMMIYSVSPTFTKLFDIKIIPPKIAKYFSKILEEAIKFREEKNIIRPDMLHLLLQAKTTDEITTEDIISQAFLFFLAGFETTSTLLSFTMYELAIHQNIQDRLRNEITSISGEITYEKLQNFKYLDMVISETLRKWPPAGVTDRVVTKEFTIEPEKPEETPVTLEEGIDCWLPIWPLHYDPEYFPEPEKFDPERFSDKEKIIPFSYSPFGFGPRNCIGSRFALLEAKLLVFYILKKFQVVPVKKTLIPMVLDPKQFTLVPKGGMWLGFKKLIQ